VPDNLSNNWGIDELRATFDLFGGAGSDSEIRSEIRFLRAAARLIWKRGTRADAGEDSSHLAVLILETRERDDPFLTEFELEPMLDQARATINGRLWLANEQLNFGHFREHDRAGSDLFSWIVDDLALGNRPAIVFDPTTDGGELRYYEAGLSDLGNVKPYPVGYIRPVSFEEVKEVIDLVHVESLISPQHQVNNVSTWKSPQRRWASDNAEAVIQAQLKVGLKQAFLFCDVSKEGPVSAGRFDLTISYIDPQTKARTCYGVLELKALKSFGSTGGAYTEATNITAIRDGLVQAYSYRDDLEAAWSALCCFDMRSSEDVAESCFDSVRADATAHEVHLTRWRLFHTVKAYREARVAS
jgi:hypothetical protein